MAVAAGEGGYWAPDVGSLWFTKSNRLYAVQVEGPIGSERAEAIAIAIAMELATRV